MISLELILGVMLVGALTFYLLFAGADFGAGIWSLFASGAGRRRQRALIDQAIGPIWEANHVWLIVAVTILFTAFPSAFAVISTGLHIPLSLMLIGIVLRGTAFAVRTHDISSHADGRSTTPEIWRYIFSASSIVTPTLLGASLGAIASGRLIRASDSFHETFVAPWLAPFPLAVGIMTTAVAAYLAAVYLLIESGEEELRRQFRLRAIAAWMVVAVSAAVALSQAREGAPEIYQGLTKTGLGLTAVIFTAAVNLGALMSLLARRDRLARFLAMLGAVSMLWGWALSQFPFLVEPELTIYDAAPSPTLEWLLVSLLGGSVVLFPLLWYLYRIFKGRVLG